MRFLEYERCVKKESENRVLRTAATFSNREESDVRKSYDNASKEGSNDGRSLLSLETGFEADSLGRVASRRVASGGVRLQARKNARKLLKTVSNRGHSAVYASFFRRCNFLFASRTPTLLLSIKGEECPPDTTPFRGHASPVV